MPITMPITRHPRQRIGRRNRNTMLTILRRPRVRPVRRTAVVAVADMSRRITDDRHA